MICALIPLRGGSKGIKNKNIKKIAGKPLCAWVLEAAANSELIDGVYVSTDSDKIKQVVSSLDLEITVINRPKKYATDKATTESVMLHFMKKIKFQTLVTIQATSPMLTSNDLDQALSIYKKNKYDTLLSAVRVKRFFWSEDAKALNYNPLDRPRRQDFRGFFLENGAFYITSHEILQQYKCRLGGKIGIFEMSEEALYEIDTLLDWNIVENLLNHRK